jgi:hypothetical protein
VSLALTWPCSLCLLRVFLCASATIFPLSMHSGEGDTLPAFSGLCVYLQFMWEMGLPPLLWSFPPTLAFTSFPAPDYWAVLLLLPAAMFVSSSRGKWVFPPLLWSFPPSATPTSFPAPGCWVRPPLLREPLLPAWLVSLQFREGFLSPNFRCSVRPTLFPTCPYCSHCLLVSFCFLPGWRSVCPGGFATLAQPCLWEYRGTAKLTLSASSQAVWARVTGAPGSSLFLRVS